VRYAFDPGTIDTDWAAQNPELADKYFYKNKRIEATPKAIGLCPGCFRQVRAKCGPTMPWHWSHIDLGECGKYWEPMTVWHVEWQNEVPEECREVYMRPHRADILTKDGCVVEIQHSPISAFNIIKREIHYGERMVWIFDMREKYALGKMSMYPVRSVSKILRDQGSVLLQLVPRCARSLEICQRRVFFDMGEDKLFWVKKFHPRELEEYEDADGVLHRSWTKAYWQGDIIDRDTLVRELNK